MPGADRGKEGDEALTDYRLVLFIHVLAAVVWVGGATYLQIQARRVLARGNPSEIEAFSRDAGEVAQKVFIPASIVLLLGGIYLVLDADWGFDHFWILSSLVVLIASAIVGASFFGPESKRLGELVAARGSEDHEVQARIRRIVNMSAVELVFLILVVFNMTYKPFL
jgi:uncharacterized membrane protein